MYFYQDESKRVLSSQVIEHCGIPMCNEMLVFLANVRVVFSFHYLATSR